MNTNTDIIRSPYPPSEAIQSVTFASASSMVRKAQADNWPITWADDDNQYAAHGDGPGFGPPTNDWRKDLSLGFAKISGPPDTFKGIAVRSDGERYGPGPSGPKPSGMLMIDGALYMWVRNMGTSRITCSKDYARSWEWGFTWSRSFGCPTFLNFGRNYAGARDEYVYVYSHDSDSAYWPADRMVMARTPKSEVMNRDAYQFFKGVDSDGNPAWTKDIGERGAVFTHLGKCYRSGISYNEGLRRYLWCQTLPGGDPRFEGGFGIYEAPEPWGPWKTVYFTKEWDVGPGETSSFPTKWMSADGKVCYLVFSGDNRFSVRRATFYIQDRP